MMSRLFKQQRGWTLIELMIVVIIIGIIAALAVPRFLTASTSTKQSEAKLLLKQVYQAERTYFQEYDTYWIPGAAIDESAGVCAHRYQHSRAGSLLLHNCGR